MKNEVDAEDNTNKVIFSKELPVTTHVAISNSDQLKLLVSALWVELKKRRQSVVGNKAALRSRLKTTLLEKFPVYATIEKEKVTSKVKKKAADNMPGFPIGAWRKILSTDIQVEDPK